MYKRQVFDMTKLKWMNGEYIKAMDFDAFYEKALPFIKETVHRDVDYRKIGEMVKTVSYTHLVDKNCVIGFGKF